MLRIVTGWVLVPTGLVLAVILVPQFLHWIALIHTTVVTHGGDFLGVPKRRLLWALPFVLLLSPRSYLILSIAVTSVYALIGAAPEALRWLLLGFYLYVAFILLIVVPKVVRAQRRAKIGVAPNSRWSGP